MIVEDSVQLPSICNGVHEAAHAQEARESEGVVLELNRKGVELCDAGHFADAQELLLRAEGMVSGGVQSRSRLRQLAMSKNNLGYLAKLAGNLDAAATFMEAALRIENRLGKPLPTTTLNLTAVLKAKGIFNKARDLAKLTLELLYESEADQPAIVWVAAWHNLAVSQLHATTKIQPVEVVWGHFHTAHALAVKELGKRHVMTREVALSFKSAKKSWFRTRHLKAAKVKPEQPKEQNNQYVSYSNTITPTPAPPSRREERLARQAARAGSAAPSSTSNSNNLFYYGGIRERGASAKNKKTPKTVAAATAGEKGQSEATSSLLSFSSAANTANTGDWGRTPSPQRKPTTTTVPHKPLKPIKPKDLPKPKSLTPHPPPSNHVKPQPHGHLPPLPQQPTKPKQTTPHNTPPTKPIANPATSVPVETRRGIVESFLRAGEYSSYASLVLVMGEVEETGSEDPSPALRTIAALLPAEPEGLAVVKSLMSEDTETYPSLDLLEELQETPAELRSCMIPSPKGKRTARFVDVPEIVEAKEEETVVLAPPSFGLSDVVGLFGGHAALECAEAALRFRPDSWMYAEEGWEVVRAHQGVKEMIELSGEAAESFPALVAVRDAFGGSFSMPEGRGSLGSSARKYGSLDLVLNSMGRGFPHLGCLLEGAEEEEKKEEKPIMDITVSPSGSVPASEHASFTPKRRQSGLLSLVTCSPKSACGQFNNLTALMGTPEAEECQGLLMAFEVCR